MLLLSRLKERRLELRAFKFYSQQRYSWDLNLGLSVNCCITLPPGNGHKWYLVLSRDDVFVTDSALRKEGKFA